MSLVAFIPILGSLIDKLLPDRNAAEAAKLKMLELAQNGELEQMRAQTAINQTEAANPNTFVSGWRPFIGWVCGAACAWNWVGISILKTFCGIAGLACSLQAADISEMLPVLMAMLGLGGYRTYEKIRGVAAK